MCKDLDRGGRQVALRREIDGPKVLPERGCQRITEHRGPTSQSQRRSRWRNYGAGLDQSEQLLTLSVPDAQRAKATLTIKRVNVRYWGHFRRV
jgi:hypothetical protein